MNKVSWEGVDARGKEILPFVYGDIQVFDNVIVTRGSNFSII